MALRQAVRGWLLQRFQSLPFGVRYELFYQAARALGVTAYRVDGTAGRFYGPVFDQAIIKPYLREEARHAEVVAIMEGYFSARGGGVLYDIGTNIGMISVQVARDARVRCVAFEPDPGNFALLRANVLENCPHGNVELRNLAVAAAPGVLRFAQSAFNSGDHHLSADGELEVRAVRLDDEPAPGEGLAVKIDTQGAEAMIFAGGEAFLSRADLILCEFWPARMRQMGQGPEPVLNFIRRHVSRGQVLRHDERAGTPYGVDEVLARLQTVIDDPNPDAQVDVLLRR